MAILRGDVPGAWVSGEGMQHISLDRRQPVDYLSPGPSNDLINRFCSFGIILNVHLGFCYMLHVWLGVREGPDAKFHSGIRVELRDMLGYGVLSYISSSLAPLYLVPVNRAFMHLFLHCSCLCSYSSSFISFPSGAFTTSLITFQVIVTIVHIPCCLKCQLCKTLYVCSRSVLMFVSTHPVSCATDVWCSHCLVFVTQRVLV